MGRMFKYIVFSLLCCFIISCEEPESYSVIPEITYKENKVYVFVDTLLGNKTVRVDITFNFVDGDGDIGSYDGGTILDPPEEADSNDFDLYINRFIFENGNYQADTTIEDNYYHIPFFRATGRDKFLKGEVTLSVDDYLGKFDTMMFEFYIYDRARNKSNTENTPQIVVNNDSLI